MKNVFDIKREESLNFILPQNMVLEREHISKAVFIIHLHYLDTAEEYMRYIEQIPYEIDVYVTVADENVHKLLEKLIKGIHRENIKIIEKKNRGRDISAFLVACRKYILDYDYVGFVHDKKEKTVCLRRDTQEWIRCLWENTIGSRAYILNVLMTFAKNPEIGLLVPPLPLGEYMTTFYSDSWYGNFKHVKELADRMNLECDLDLEKPPLTLGTAFWAKTAALKKLFEIDWEYEDFDEEPLKDNGTISHAIERILAYVAQDAGYKTGWVMTDQYAGELLECSQNALEKAFDRLNDSLGICCISGLDSFELRRAEILDFLNRFESFYIYGAGVRGLSCLAMLKSLWKFPEAFLVSKMQGNHKNVNGIPVYEFAAISLKRDSGIIIAVDERNENDVLQTIKNADLNFENIFLYKKE